MRFVIFTDLDGTLLDGKYSFSPAAKALGLVKKTRTPLVICTSKNRSEILYYRKKLGNSHPFIAENGAAIFIPRKYFSPGFDYTRAKDRYLCIELGTGLTELRKGLKELSKNVKIRSFLDMTDRELARDSGLPLDQARLALRREYDVPFKLLHGKESEASGVIKSAGLNYTKGGRYSHITGKNGKGRAVRILSSLYKREWGKIITIGLGDSPNDYPMLKAVDRGFLLRKGPHEWNRVITRLLG